MEKTQQQYLKEELVSGKASWPYHLSVLCLAFVRSDLVGTGVGRPNTITPGLFHQQLLFEPNHHRFEYGSSVVYCWCLDPTVTTGPLFFSHIGPSFLLQTGLCVVSGCTLEERLIFIPSLPHMRAWCIVGPPQYVTSGHCWNVLVESWGVCIMAEHCSSHAWDLGPFSKQWDTFLLRRRGGEGRVDATRPMPLWWYHYSSALKRGCCALNWTAIPLCLVFMGKWIALILAEMVLGQLYLTSRLTLHYPQGAQEAGAKEFFFSASRSTN